MTDTSFGELWDTFTRNDILIMGAQKKKIQKMTENLFKQIMAEYFPKLGRCMDIQVHESIASHTDLTKNKQKPLSI